MSAPAVQDASWLIYSCRTTVTFRGGGGGGGGGERVRGRGGVVGCPEYVELGDDGQGVGERGRGGGNQIWYTVDTSWDAVDTRCLAG